MERFVNALCSEIVMRGSQIRDCMQYDTIYMGGGTPSVLPVCLVGHIADACSSVLGYSLSSVSEFTMEVNPDDIVKGGHRYVESLVRLGVNRVSMGVQSMDDSVLGWMNRRHNAENARSAFRILREAGMENISIDLIFGFTHPDFSVGKWRDTVEKALDISGDGRLPEHISAYQLSVEEGSLLYDMACSGKYMEPEGEVCTIEYSLLCEMLRSAGYRHYEISNFALPGYEARHNSAYWKHIPYVGAGPSAHSFLRVGDASGLDSGWMRRWNISDVDAYIDGVMSGDIDSIYGYESLTKAQFREEEIMLGLRTDSGVDKDILMSDPLSRKAVDKFLRSGALVPAGNMGYLRIPEDRFFVSDDIISELI